MDNTKEEKGCYNCKYRGTVPGDAHSSCHHPLVGDPFMALVGIITGNNNVIDKLNIRANQHGIDKGWFVFPANFDPIWLENCDGFTKK